MALPFDVQTIATDDDLVAEVASRARLERAMPNIAQRDALRSAALEDVLHALETRAPPIHAAALSAPVELKRAVVYRTLAKLFMAAVAVEGDVHHVLARHYEREYQGAVRARFSVSPLATGSSGYSFSVERR